MATRTKNLAELLGVLRPQRVPDLGARELAAMEYLWKERSASSQEIQTGLSGEPVTLSTVQTTLERLYRKGLVTRAKSGRAYRYQPVHSRSEFIGRLLQDIAADFAGGDPAPMISGFAEYIASANQEKNPDLARLLRTAEAKDV